MNLVTALLSCVLGGLADEGLRAPDAITQELLSSFSERYARQKRLQDAEEFKVITMAILDTRVERHKEVSAQSSLEKEIAGMLASQLKSELNLEFAPENLDFLSMLVERYYRRQGETAELFKSLKTLGGKFKDVRSAIFLKVRDQDLSGEAACAGVARIQVTAEFYELEGMTSVWSEVVKRVRLAEGRWGELQRTVRKATSSDDLEAVRTQIDFLRNNREQLAPFDQGLLTALEGDIRKASDNFSTEERELDRSRQRARDERDRRAGDREVSTTLERIAETASEVRERAAELVALKALIERWHQDHPETTSAEQDALTDLQARKARMVKEFAADLADIGAQIKKWQQDHPKMTSAETKALESLRAERAAKLKERDGRLASVNTRIEQWHDDHPKSTPTAMAALARLEAEWVSKDRKSSDDLAGVEAMLETWHRNHSNPTGAEKELLTLIEGDLAGQRGGQRAERTERNTTLLLQIGGGLLGVVLLGLFLRSIGQRSQVAMENRKDRREDQARVHQQQQRQEETIAQGKTEKVEDLRQYHELEERDRKSRQSFARTLSRARSHLHNGDSSSPLASELERLVSAVQSIEDGRPLRASHGDVEEATRLMDKVLSHGQASTSLADELEQQIRTFAALGSDNTARSNQEQVIRSLISRLDARLAERRDVLDRTDRSL